MQCADQWRTQDFIMGVSSYGPKGRAVEARRAESARMWFWGRDSQPSPPAMRSGERC